VGTGFNQSLANVSGETDTFKAGESVFIAFEIKPGLAREALELDLVHDNNQEDKVPILTTRSATYIYWAIVQLSASAHPGIYQWAIYYLGSFTASITFQVVS
jgi:hypothetical protein